MAAFAYTGSAQDYLVPAGVTLVEIEVWGAQGGGFGGLGGYAKGRLAVTPGETLKVYVGQQPSAAIGGWNGGGDGDTVSSPAYGGGGAADVRQGGTALGDRKIVAGAGGGGRASTGSYPGAVGGGTTGGTGTNKGGGGTQSAGGGGSTGGTGGSLGQGGAGASGLGSGGGGGFYGGGGSLYGGGGGSGYVGGVTGGSMSSGVRSGHGAVVITVVSVPPNAPILEAIPTFDRATVQRFGWTFSDPNEGDSQSKFDLQYRPVGGGAWTAVTGTTPNQFWDAPAGTFAAGDYEWQVRAYDAQGAVGPYSASGFFTAAVAPAGPVFTAPTSGATIPTASQTYVFSAPSLSEYQWRLVGDDGAGNPVPATVINAGATVTDATSRSFTVTGLPNNTVVHGQVRIKDGGLYSTWTDIRNLVSYTAPAVPVVTNLPFTVDGKPVGLRYTVTNPAPSGGQPTVVYADIYRRVVGDTSDGIRIATNVIGSHDDYAVASGAGYEVRAKAVGANGTSSWSAWTA